MSGDLQQRLKSYYTHKRRVVPQDHCYTQNAIDYYTWQLDQCKHKFDNLDKKDANFKRIIRSDIAGMLRKFHKDYVRAQYKEVDLHHSQDSVYEHVTPIKDLTQLYLLGIITVTEVLNPPVCLISKNTDKKLKDSNVSVNYDIYNFFRRYAHLQTSIEHDKDKTIVDLDKWTLQDHYDMLS